MASDDQTEDGDDERAIELETLAAIFPELVILKSGDGDEKRARLNIDVMPATPIQIRTPRTAEWGPILEDEEILPNGGERNGTNAIEHFHEIAHLPPLLVDISLPLEYPSARAPSIQLAIQGSWLSRDKLRELEQIVDLLWKELGRDQVLFSYIDYLREQAEQAFGLDGNLEVSADLEVGLLDFDLKAKKAQFQRANYECGICLEPKKGTVCHRLQLCSHVFCIECLQDFYNSCITEGDVGSVKCLATTCPEPLTIPDIEKHVHPQPNQPSDRTLEPSELAQICLAPETVQRYINLKRKKALESNRNTLYCPRQWCQGPASHNLTDPSYLAQKDSAHPPPLPKPQDRLAICLDCAFAFCLVCKASWHGEYFACFPRSQFEITAEEKASEDYMLLHTQVCPTCDARAQKTHGCNHMICFKCDTHFCYLCGSYLEKGNPYEHFNNRKGTCYMRLWELEGGDDGEIGHAFGGVGGGGGDMGDWDSDDESDQGDDGHGNFEQLGDVLRPIPLAPVPPAVARPRLERAPIVNARHAERGVAGPGLRAFLEMARRDAEDEWDSDEMSEDEEDEIEGHPRFE